jgi:protocatechuate 3,4-dioxygenase, alpha subunit
MLIATPHQTIGPYWHLIEDPAWFDLTRFGIDGEKINLIGAVYDGAGDPVTDAAIEIWQTSPAPSSIFQGFGRCRTDATGFFRFITIKPGPIAGLGNALQAPHVAVSIFARGLLRGLTTRLYFRGEPLNTIDPILSSIETEVRRQTLIAEQTSADTWCMNIRLQGDNETVFMEL